MDEGEETDDPRVAWRGGDETKGDKSKKPRRESESRETQKESGRWEEEEEEEEGRRGDAGREKKREEKGTRGKWKGVGNRSQTRGGREDQVFNARGWIFFLFFSFFLFSPHYFCAVEKDASREKRARANPRNRPGPSRLPFDRVPPCGLGSTNQGLRRRPLPISEGEVEWSAVLG